VQTIAGHTTNQPGNTAGQTSDAIAYAEFRVPDLERAVPFYRDLAGLSEVSRRDGRARLAGSPDTAPVVMLTEDRGAKPRFPRSAGLFHLALLYPTRRDLALAFQRLHDHAWQFHGFADHGVSEALYMTDVDGNGIELYVDRQREHWPLRNGELEMVTEPLDFNSLLSELAHPAAESISAPIRAGHIHLQVTDLRRAEQFYHNTLGFDVTQRTFAGALFLSARGYHHHIGLNVWNSHRGHRFEDGATGLVQFGIQSRDLKDRQSVLDQLRTHSIPLEPSRSGFVVRDPDNIRIEIL